MPWKSAVVVTIPKKVGFCSPGELRPISLTSNLGKILEMVVMRNIERELKVDAIPDHQFGFRVGHSTVDTLLVLTNHVEEHRRRGLTNAICSLDVKKAFDTVWHQGIVYKMSEMGCEISTCRTVQSFLADRRARIRIDGTLSPSFKIARGVPQGSRLGPLLFNIYMANLKVVPKNKFTQTGLLLQYADDTLLVSKGNGPKQAVERVAKAVEQVVDYFTNWGIELNEKKTDLLITLPGTKRALSKKQKEIELKVGKERVKPKSSLLYLGVLLDGKGTWKPQVKAAAKKARGALGACKKIMKNTLLKMTKVRLIYKTLIRSRGAYGATIWLNDKNKEPMLIMERWAYRYGVKMKRNIVTGHWPRNEILYNEWGEKELKFDEFIDKCRIKYMNKARMHSNKMVRRCVE